MSTQLAYPAGRSHEIHKYIYIHARFSGAFILLSGVSEISREFQMYLGEKERVPEAESGWRGLVSLKVESKRKRIQRLKKTQVLLPEERQQV